MEQLAVYDNERRYIFSNWTKEDFVAVFGGVQTLIKSGETIEVPQYKAYHFTRHLVNREMIRDKVDGSMDSPEARKPYEDKTIAEITAGIDSPALASLKEQIAEEILTEKGGKKKKIVPKDAKEGKVEVKEFEDIKE